jgi:transcription elongation factor GreA
MGEKYYLTLAGLQKYKEEYERLKKLKTATKLKIKESRDELWRPEDLNPDYEALYAELNFAEKRLKEMEDILENVKVIRTRSTKRITMGAMVVVKVEGTKDEFTIVGTLEANPSEGKISNESPVGKALMGHKVGDKVIVSSPIKTVYKVIEIRNAP